MACDKREKKQKYFLNFKLKKYVENERKNNWSIR